MKVLIACTPATGHIDPMFSLGRLLTCAGHEVLGMSSTVMRDRILRSGASFRALPTAADLDLRDLAAAFPEYKSVKPGLEMSRFFLDRVFIDPIPAQYQGIRESLSEFPADIILCDNFFYGALPLLLGPRHERPPIIVGGTMFLHYRRDDQAPNFIGLPPASNESEQHEYAAIREAHDEALYAPVRRHLAEVLAGLGVSPPAMDPHEAVIALPDAYLQLTVPSFEFPRRELPASVHFVGCLPIIPNQAPIPPWAGDLDGSRKVVLVSQGTVSNHDFGQLVQPTLSALENEPDVLVIVTTGGRPVSSIPHPIPTNARVAEYLPFDWLLPKVDVFVTNGGYGSVNQALSHGIPLVAAGLSEDKADNNVRISWAGVGIDLRTREPASSSLRSAIRAVLSEKVYREKAGLMAEEFRRTDTQGYILTLITRLAGSQPETRV